MTGPIAHSIAIATQPDTVYRLLSTCDGLANWWTPNVVAHMNIVALDPGRKVEWFCTGGLPEWEGTSLAWALAPERNGCRLDFTHDGWRALSRTWRICNTDWGRLMYVLKQVAETGEPAPFME